VKRFAVISDIHIAAFRQARPWDFFNQRIIGLVNWALRRRHHFPKEIRDALFHDLRKQKASGYIDGLIVCGDLSTLAMPEEFDIARELIESIGFPPEAMIIIPGNHDSYTKSAHKRRLFENAFRCLRTNNLDSQSSLKANNTRFQKIPPADNQTLVADDAGIPEIYPYVIDESTFAIIGISTATPSRPMYATGRIGSRQLIALKENLARCKTKNKTVVLVMHHPPEMPKTLAHKSLLDSDAFQDVISENSPTLILHGHLHKRVVTSQVIGNNGKMNNSSPRHVPVRGLPASCYNSKDDVRWPAYSLLDLENPNMIAISWRKYDYETNTYKSDDLAAEVIKKE